MSEHEKCPIEPDEALRFTYGPEEDDYLLIAASHDSIIMFPDSKYNHLRYYDYEEGAMRMVFLPPEALADLYDAGIPHTKRNSISQCEYEGWQDYMGRVAMNEVEIDPIDAEVQKAHQTLDAELDYYLHHEWE